MPLSVSEPESERTIKREKLHFEGVLNIYRGCQTKCIHTLRKEKNCNTQCILITKDEYKSSVYIIFFLTPPVYIDREEKKIVEKDF